VVALLPLIEHQLAKKEKASSMYYLLHHAAVSAVPVQQLQQFLAAYDALHPGVITSHGTGFLGKNYLISATENIAEAVRSLGIPCAVHALPKE
jgi:hypothetical protein